MIKFFKKIFKKDPTHYYVVIGYEHYYQDTNLFPLVACETFEQAKECKNKIKSILSKLDNYVDKDKNNLEITMPYYKNLPMYVAKEISKEELHQHWDLEEKIRDYGKAVKYKMKMAFISPSLTSDEAQFIIDNNLSFIDLCSKDKFEIHHVPILK